MAFPGAWCEIGILSIRSSHRHSPLSRYGKNDDPILKMSFSKSKFKSTVSSQELIMNNGLSSESRELRRHLLSHNGSFIFKMFVEA